jgi:hypothetical protein
MASSPCHTVTEPPATLASGSDTAASPPATSPTTATSPRIPAASDRAGQPTTLFAALTRSVCCMVIPPNRPDR